MTHWHTIEGTDFVLTRFPSKAVLNVQNLFLPGYCEQTQNRSSLHGWGDWAGVGEVLTVAIESEVRFTYFDTASKKSAPGAVYYDSSFGGEDSDSDMDIFFLCLSFSAFLSHTHRDLNHWILNLRMNTERYVTKCGMRIPWYLLIKRTVCTDVWEIIYWFTHTPSHTVSYPPSTKCHKHPVSRFRYQVKKCQKVTQTLSHYDIVTTLHKKIACGASLRRLCEASTFKWLFKICLQPFPQKHLLNTFKICQKLFLQSYGCGWQGLVLF